MEELLKVFTSLTEHLGTLTELAKQKTLAVRKSDLKELDRILREEQAQALALRGLEQKRVKLLNSLGLTDVSLTELPAKAGQQQQQARDTVETLRHAYQVYRSAADTARNTLECHLHEIEHFLLTAGASDNNTAEPPSAMKSDFRA